MYPHGIFRITVAAPRLSVANPAANAEASIAAIGRSHDSDLVVLPELGLTGYTCGDLFASDALLRRALDALGRVIEHSRGHAAIVIVGLPLVVDGSLMNVAALVAGGRLVGVVPKTYLPTYREYYEARHFRGSGAGDPEVVTVDGRVVPFGTDLLFRRCQATLGVELCEDVWTPLPPSSLAAVAGANVLVNLSASNETIGKAAWRRELVTSQSGRCIAAYAYASAGPGESTSDFVYGGQCLIAENGRLLGESRRVGDGLEPPIPWETSLTRDVDLEAIGHDRRVIGSFDDLRDRQTRRFRHVDIDEDVDEDHGGDGASGGEHAPRDVASGDPRRPAGGRPEGKARVARRKLFRDIQGQPFVPAATAELRARCGEILSLQTAGLAKRLTRIPNDTPLAIGVSGGLDSTLAVLVAVRTCDAMQIPRTRIRGITMPGFGTTAGTRENATDLIAAMGLTAETIDIRPLCLDTFRAIGHSPMGIRLEPGAGDAGGPPLDAETLQARLLETPDSARDLVFENVQARVRTLLLMSRGFVIGTGDMSEQALGWSTYNADHMSMYNVNTSVPKTLVRFLVRYAADHLFDGETRQLLHRIADTPISPELLPPAADGSLRQDTEAVVGAYELHDFFLYHFVRHGCDREKIVYLAEHADFSREFTREEVEATLEIFWRRFFANQFKRNCVPDGPKVGSVCLSPRGDWRMPSDADVDTFGQT